VKRSKLVVIIVVPTLLIALIMSLFNASLSPYVSVTEVVQKKMYGVNVQVFGDVLNKTISFDMDSGILTFDITDGNNTLTIQHQGVVNNLRNATQVVAIGTYGRDGIFHAQKILVKCPSKYQGVPREEG